MILNYKKTIVIGLMCLLQGAYSYSQDLSGQRAEIQNILKVPGEKIDHNGIIINPTPHNFNLLEGGLNIAKGCYINDKTKTFGNTFDFLNFNPKGVKIDVEFGAKKALKYGVKAVEGAYYLKIDKKKIKIVGYDAAGVFYAFQTIRQITESPIFANGILPCLEINDYPDLLHRGVVEGFYGNPWSHKVRLSLINFYGKFKLNTYIYGPKDDPYHSSPNWRLPYPEKEAKDIKELIDACKKNYVNFVWAIHPGGDIKWNEEDFNNLVNKFQMMYDLGVRDFAIFFDDISGEGTNPNKQTELLNRLNEEFVKTHEGVGTLSVCPTDYTKLWANPTQNGSLAIYGKTLHPSIKVFWTGDVVCSDLTKSTSNWVNSRINRPNYFWWNFPVTDYCRHILLQGPVYGLDTTLTSKDVSGVVSNPMEHGEASKLALYSVADYTWNIKAYNALDSWERALAELMPNAYQAYRTFAIHSADTQTGYRRDESWETNTFRINNWNDALADSLFAEFVKVEQAPTIIENNAQNKALLAELQPWLLQTKKLGQRGQRTIELAKIYRQGGDNAKFWNAYINNVMSNDDRQEYNAHKVGTMKLQPFYEYAMDDMSHSFLSKLIGKEACDFKGIASFASAYTPQVKLMFDSDTTTYYTSGTSQKPNDWIGVDLHEVRELKNIHILQGRNSKDDVDFFDHAILEYSTDGKTWEPLIEDIQKQYVINWKGEGKVARYVRLRRLDSNRKNYAAVREFKVNPLSINDLSYKITAPTNNAIVNAFDENLNTLFNLQGNINIVVPPKAKNVIVLFGKINKPLVCKQLDKDNNVLSTMDISKPYADIKIDNDNVAFISIDGKAPIYEVIVK